MTGRPVWRHTSVRERAWLLRPPLLLALLDFVCTLSNQSAAYWRFAPLRPRLVREAAPHARWLLQGHPLAFVAGALALLAGYALLVVLLPRRWALVASIAIATAHASAAGTWFYLMIPRPWAYWARVALMVLVAVMLVTAMERTP